MMCSTILDNNRPDSCHATLVARLQFWMAAPDPSNSFWVTRVRNAQSAVDSAGGGTCGLMKLQGGQFLPLLDCAK